MDPEADVTNRKSWNFIAFIINGAIGLILPIVMFILIAYGYAIPEYSCADSFIDINVRWGLIFSIPILMLINIQSYLLTRGKKFTWAPWYGSRLISFNGSDVCYALCNG